MLHILSLQLPTTVIFTIGIYKVMEYIPAQTKMNDNIICNIKAIKLMLLQR